MRNFRARSTVAILLALQVFSPAFVFSQQGANQKQPVAQPTQEGPRAQQQTSRPADSSEWKIADPLRIISPDQPGIESSGKQEPTIRVALATDARAATISTSGHLMNATDLATAPDTAVSRRTVLNHQLVSDLRQVVARVT